MSYRSIMNTFDSRLHGYLRTPAGIACLCLVLLVMPATSDAVLSFWLLFPVGLLFTLAAAFTGRLATVIAVSISAFVIAVVAIANLHFY